MPPTLLGVLLPTCGVIPFVPGGPVGQYLAEATPERLLPALIRARIRPTMTI
jgi:ABC-type microcin C transport system permease subunit YejB